MKPIYVKQYKAVTNGIKDYRALIVEYIQSYAGDGYLSLVDVNGEDDDAVNFKMGQHKFMLQMTSLHHTSTILLRTYRMPRYPERNVTMIKEMEIRVEGVSDLYKGAPQFMSPQHKEDMWGVPQKEAVTNIEHFPKDYFDFLDLYIKRLYEIKKDSIL